MACSYVPAVQLKRELSKLERSMQTQINEAISFRKANAQFDKKSDTVQLLLGVCEKLWAEKVSMDHANLEMHSSELPYLCQHFNTVLDAGLMEQVHAEKLSAVRSLERNSRYKECSEGRRLRFPFGGLCCASEFPPSHQGWWLEVLENLAPHFQVLRNGNLSNSAGTDLVPGDIFFIHAGQKADIDARVLVLSEGSVVDVSHVTGRANDVRVCTPATTAQSAVESRNIVLKNSFIVRGSLFCMAVRPQSNPYVSHGDAGHDVHEEPGIGEGQETAIDTTVPAGQSLSVCRSLFRALCVKARLFCKSFRMFEQVSKARFLVVILTDALLAQGTVSQFCAAALKAKRVPILISCITESNSDALNAFCEAGGIKQWDLEAADAGREVGAEDATASTSAINLEVCPGLVHERVGETEQGRLRVLLEELEASDVNGTTLVAHVVNGLSEAGLLHICRRLRSLEQPLLYAATGFHYSRCLLSLTASAADRKQTSINSIDSTCFYVSTDSPASVPSHTVQRGDGLLTPASTHDGKILDLALTNDSLNLKPGLAAPVPSRRASHNSTPSTSLDQSSPVHGGVRSNTDRESSCSVTVMRSDPALFLVNQQQTKMMKQHSPNATNQVVVAVDAIGIVSDLADCVLLKADLGCLAQALELISRKLKA